jgi:hypothetical protein
VSLSDPKLSGLAVQIETLKARLAEIAESGERRILLHEMWSLLQDADQIIKDYVEYLTKDSPS